jgi:hypothetical protein
MNCHLPLPVIAFECGTGCVIGVETFAEVGGKSPGGRFVTGETGDGGGRTHPVQVCPLHPRDFGSLTSFEILDVALVSLCGFPRREGAEIATLASARIFFARIKPVLAVDELADHPRLPA